MSFQRFGGLLASPDNGKCGNRSLRRAISNLESIYTPMPHLLREAESDLGWLDGSATDPLPKGLNNDNFVQTSSLYDDLNSIERAAIQGLGLQTDFENLRRPVSHSHSAPGNGLRAQFEVQGDGQSISLVAPSLTRRAASHLGFGPNSDHKDEGSNYDGGVSLDEREQLKTGPSNQGTNLVKDFEKVNLSFDRIPYARGTWADALHRNTRNSSESIFREVESPLFQQRSHEGQQVHENFSNARAHFDKQGIGERQNSNSGRFFAGHGLGDGGLLQGGWNRPAYFTGRGDGIPDTRDLQQNVHNNSKRYSMAPNVCLYADRPEAFGGPFLNPYDLPLMPGNRRPGGNTKPYTLPTIRVQAPEEFRRNDYSDSPGAVFSEEDRASIPFQRGLGALRLAADENWHIMHEPINPIINQVNEHTRFYVIKSTSELDVYSSMKWGMWTSTDLGNKRLDKGFRTNHGIGPVILFFSINASGKFCGVAEMTSTVDFMARAGIWTERRWRGRFDVKWLYVKDIPMSSLRHITVENNDGKNIAMCRDTQELLPDAGFQMLHMFNAFPSSSGMLFDSNQGVTRCAPRGHTLERIVLPREGRSQPPPPPPRALPNFFGEPAGYSRNNSLPSCYEVLRSSGNCRGRTPERTYPRDGYAPIQSGYVAPPMVRNGSTHDIRCGTSFEGFNGGRSDPPDLYTSDCSGPFRSRGVGYREQAPPSHSGNPTNAWGGYETHQFTLPKELIERSKEHGFDPYTGRYYDESSAKKQCQANPPNESKGLRNSEGPQPEPEPEHEPEHEPVPEPGLEPEPKPDPEPKPKHEPRDGPEGTSAGH